MHISLGRRPDQAGIGQAWAEDRSFLFSHRQDSEDIRYMVGALETLGVAVDVDWVAATAVVAGCSGRFPVQGAELYLGNAGTAMR